MKVQDFLEHFGIGRNPFAEEEAQTDPVFKSHCIESTYHPTWDKVFGDPHDPATSIVFGEKGAGKTAIRLQIAKHLEEFNLAHPSDRIALLHYDEFNPFLDRFASRFRHGKKPEKVLERFELWDHMDAMLSLATTTLVDQFLESKAASGTATLRVDPRQAGDLDRHQARDLLMLAAFYDTSSAETHAGRWHRLRRATNYFAPAAFWASALAVVWSVVFVVALISLLRFEIVTNFDPLWLYALVFLLGWLPLAGRYLKAWWIAGRIRRHLRVGRVNRSTLTKLLTWFSPSDLAGQPLPLHPRTEDRYELLGKLQRVLDAVGYRGMIVVVDRVDEPHLINGAAQRMKRLVWPLLDNKFLKQPNLGFKLLLPAELKPYVDREEPEFHQRARLDKQNVIPSFEWTGEALQDLTDARLQACAANGSQPTLREMLDDAISDQRLLEIMRTLRVPRHLFKFLYRVLVAHCNAHPAREPRWTIEPDIFETQFALYVRERETMSS